MANEAHAPSEEVGQRLALKGMLFNLLQCVPDDEDSAQIERILQWLSSALQAHGERVRRETCEQAARLVADWYGHGETEQKLGIEGEIRALAKQGDKP